MYKIFLIIFVFQSIKADDDESNEKYIDLLPEEDKQEFLNRIARRILEEVNISDIPNASHAEVNAEQLDAQNDYVKQIIKEESKILQNERRDNIVINNQEINNKVDKNSDNQPHIDLTLRTRSRKKRNDSKLNEHLDTTSDLKVIPVKIYQGNVKSNDNSAIKSELQEDIQANKGKDITIEYKSVKNESITVNESKSIGNVSIVRRSHDDESLFRTTISNFDPDSEPDSEENVSSIEDETIVSSSTISPHHIDNLNTTESDNEIIWISTKKIYDSGSNEDINPGSAENISSSILTTLPDVEQVTTSSIINSTLESEGSSQEITTLKIDENVTNFNQSSNINTSQVILNNHLYLRSGELENGSNITQLATNELSDLKTYENDTYSVKKIVNKTISETNLNSNDTNISDTRSRYLVNNKKEINTDVKVKASQISLRENYASKESEIEIKLQKHNLKSNAKEYEVFEVAADKPPFLMKPNVEIQDMPHYVPVYNYALNYAYYRPRSRFEPNEDSKDDDENKNYEIYRSSDEAVNKINEKSQLNSPIIRSIFSGYDNREKDFYRNKPGRYIKKKQNYNLFDLKRPTQFNNFQNIYYNPNDYLDMDYYFGRSDGSLLRKGSAESANVEEGFPDSNDKDHPYHSIHMSDTIKDHIRAVRNLLYLNHVFEPISEMKRNKRRQFYKKRIQSQNDTKNNTRDELRNKNEDNIAIDYYFGVMPNEKSVQAVTMRKPNNNKLLRKPPKNKGLKINANYDELNFISNRNSIDDKVKNKLDEDIEPVLEVLRDFIRFDNIAMSRYNWLESTVDILAAVKKLLQLMKQLQFGDYINPKDLELIKYILYLYKSSFNTLKEKEQHYIIKKDLNDGKEIIERNKSLLPKNKRNHKIRQPLKLWRDMFNFIRNRDVKQDRVKLLYDFENFLQNMLFRLHDFHNAIKHIAMITKYNNQKWYEDFKNIYLHNLSNDKMLTLLLHLSVAKLLKSIEESATDGAENSFMKYIIYNKQYVERSKEEFLFVLNILHELRKLNVN